MRIAIMSDTHGKESTVRKALHLAKQEQVDLILHCGDIDDPETVELFPGHTHFVFGNCDQDREGIRQAVEKIGGTLHENFGYLDPSGVAIAFLHSDDATLFRDLQTSGAFRFIFYGHTHLAGEHRVGKTRVINPGALYRAAKKNFAVLEVETAEGKTMEVE